MPETKQWAVRWRGTITRDVGIEYWMAETASHACELFEAQYPMRRVLKIWRVPQAKAV